MKPVRAWLCSSIAILGFFASSNALSDTNASKMDQAQIEIEHEAKMALPKIPHFPHTGNALLERLLKITAGAGSEVRPGFIDDAFGVSAWPWQYHDSIAGGFSRVDYNFIPAVDDWYIYLREIDTQPMWAFQMSVKPGVSYSYALLHENASFEMSKAMCIPDKKIIAAVLQQGWQLRNSPHRNAKGQWLGFASFVKDEKYSIIMSFLEPKQNEDPCLIYMSVN
jgi:hypothetical protein